jgi:hypothetical protein
LGELGASLKATAKNGATPEMLARESGNLETVELLRKWHIAQAKRSRFLYRTLRGKIGNGAVIVDAFAFGECACALCNLSVKTCAVCNGEGTVPDVFAGLAYAVIRARCTACRRDARNLDPQA